MCIIDTNGEKKHCGVRPYQRTAYWEKLFFLPNGFGGQRPPKPSSPPGSDTPPAVPADSCEDGRILSHVRVTARCP